MPPPYIERGAESTLQLLGGSAQTRDGRAAVALHGAWAAGAVDRDDGVIGAPARDLGVALGDAALAHLDPTDDIHASAAYRAQLVRVLTARVVRSARAASAEGAA